HDGQSALDCHRTWPLQGADKDREVYWRGGSQGNLQEVRSVCIAWENRQGRVRTATVGCLRPRPPLRRRGYLSARIGRSQVSPSSDAEALAAAALDLRLGILKLEGLVETLLDEVHQGPVDEGQAQGIDHYFDPACLENRIVRPDLVRVVDD